MSIVGGLVELAADYPAGLVGLDRYFVRGLSDFARRCVGIAMAFRFGLAGATGAQC